MNIYLAISVLALSACSSMPTAPANPPGTNTNTVDAIQQSCDNKENVHTFINGHDYFCADFDTTQKAINELMRRAQQRGA